MIEEASLITEYIVQWYPVRQQYLCLKEQPSSPFEDFVIAIITTYYLHPDANKSEESPQRLDRHRCRSP